MTDPPRKAPAIDNYRNFCVLRGSGQMKTVGQKPMEINNPSSEGNSRIIDFQPRWKNLSRSAIGTLIPYPVPLEEWFPPFQAVQVSFITFMLTVVRSHSIRE